MGRLRIPRDEWVEVKITLRVSDHLHDALMTEARARGLSMNELGMRILHQYLAAQDPEPVDRYLADTKTAHHADLELLRRSLDDLPPDRRRDPDWD